MWLKAKQEHRLQCTVVNLRYCSPSVTARGPPGLANFSPRISVLIWRGLMDLQTVVAALNKPPYNYGVTAVTLRFVIYALDVLLEIPCRKSTTQA